MPDYEITSPDGKKYRITAPDGATQEQVLAYAQSQFSSQGQQQATSTLAATAQAAPQAAPLAPAAPQQANTWLNAIKNVGEAGLQATTGILGGVAADVAGLGALGYDITANAMIHPFSGVTPSAYADPEKVRDRVASYLTYRPSNPNSLSSKIVQAPGQVIQGSGEFIGQPLENAGFTNAAHVARAVPLATASALGVKAGLGPRFNTKPFGGTGTMEVPRAVPGTPAAPAPAPTPEEVAIKSATDAGYKLSPSQVGNKVGGAVEGVSGQAALERTLSKKNVTITDNLAKKSLGVEDSGQLTPAKFTELKVKANKAYSDVAKTGQRKTSDEYRKEVNSIGDRTGSGSFAEDTPAAVTKLKEYYANRPSFDAGDAVAKIRQLRADARKNMKAVNAPEQNALGSVQQKIADALDNELERHVADIGQPNLVKQYKDARVQLAKIHTVEDAVQGTNVSAKKIHQAWKRGAPLSGELLTIARTYDSFQHVLQEASKIRGKHPFSVVDAFVAAGGAAVNPALLATVAARPAARSALASDFYQNRFVRPKGRGHAPKTPDKPQPRVGSAVAAPVPQERKAR